MSWIYLIVAGLLEVGWALGLKYSMGFTRLWPSVLTVILMIGSFYFLAKALRELPVGTGYAVWTGIGTVGTAILGVILFQEAVTPLKIGAVLLIIVGIIGLKLS